MTGNERYITEVTREDLKKLAACTDIKVGPGVKIDRTANSLTFKVDEQQLKLWLWTFNRNGGFSASQENVTSVEINKVV